MRARPAERRLRMWKLKQAWRFRCWWLPACTLQQPMQPEHRACGRERRLRAGRAETGRAAANILQRFLIISAQPQHSPASATLTSVSMVWELTQLLAFKPLHTPFSLPFSEGQSTSPRSLSPYWQLQMKLKRKESSP